MQGTSSRMCRQQAGYVTVWQVPVQTADALIAAQTLIKLRHRLLQLASCTIITMRDAFSQTGTTAHANKPLLHGALVQTNKHEQQCI